MSPIQFYWCTLFLSSAGVALSVRYGGERFTAMRLFRGLAAAILAVCSLWGLFQMLTVYRGFDLANWDTSRLLPPVALMKGFQVYSTLESGAVHTVMYPPGWVFSFLPVALASTPAGVQLIGYALAVGYVFVPVYVFSRTLAGRGAAAWLLFGLFYFMVQHLPPVVGSVRPHADAPALGFALLSAVLLWRGVQGTEDDRRLLLTSAFFCCLSVWAKQVMVPVIPVLLFWCLVTGGRKRFVRFFFYCLGSGLAQGLVFLCFFNPEGVFFNIFTIPSRCPWRAKALVAIRGALSEIVGHSRWMGLILLFPGGLRLVRSRARLPQLFRQNAWILYLLLAMGLLPTSILGRVKIGGYPNTLSPFLFFCVAAVCAVLCESARKDLAAVKGAPGRFLRWGGVLVLLGFAGIWTRETHRVWNRRPWPVTVESSAQQAYEYLRRSDSADAVLFPTLPLVHLLAGDRYTHFSSAVFDREVLARFPLSDSQKALWTSPEFRKICWLDPHWGTEYVEPRYFRDFTEEKPDPALPGFRCMIRPSKED